MLNLPSVASLTYLARFSPPVKMASALRGKLEARRQWMVGNLAPGQGRQGCATGGGAQCGLLEETNGVALRCLLGVEECGERGPFA